MVTYITKRLSPPLLHSFILLFKLLTLRSGGVQSAAG